MISLKESDNFVRILPQPLLFAPINIFIVIPMKYSTHWVTIKFLVGV